MLRIRCGKQWCRLLIDAFLSIFQFLYANIEAPWSIRRGADVELLERLGDSAESRRKVRVRDWTSPCDETPGKLTLSTQQ